MVRSVRCCSVTGHTKLFRNTSVFLKSIPARLRSGDQWYAWLFRKILRAVVRINPNIILNQMVPRMTPNFADEKFMKELR